MFAAAAYAAIPRLSLANDPTSIFQVSRNRSTSRIVLRHPRLTRTAPRASDGSTPLAASTAEAVLADVLQAAAGRPGPAPLATAVPLPDDGAQEDELGGLEPLPGLEAA